MGDPPLILALETATSVLSVALLRGEQLIDDQRAGPGSAAKTLLPAVDTLLERAGVRLEELDAFAVSIGPGSFTGLRVGIATAKGLAFGMEGCVVGVSTLAALARSAPPGSAGDTTVVPMLDARRGEVYAAAYSGPGLAGELRSPCAARATSSPARAAGSGDAGAALAEGVYTVDELCERLQGPCLLVGEGTAVCGEELVQRLGESVSVIPAPQGEARARHVGVLGARCLARGEGVTPADLAARYMRRAEAEVKRTGLRFESPPGQPPGA